MVTYVNENESVANQYRKKAPIVRKREAWMTVHRCPKRPIILATGTKAQKKAKAPTQPERVTEASVQ